MPDINQVMKLFQDQAQEMRNAARETRSMELSSQVGALKDAAADIRAAAEQRMQASIVAGATQIAGGAMSLGGLGGHAMSEKSSALHGASQELAGAKAGLAGVDTIHASQMATGVNYGMGSMVGAAVDAKQAEMAAKHAEASVAMHNNPQTNANELVKQMQDVIKDVRDKMSSIQQSQLETMRNVTRNI